MSGFGSFFKKYRMAIIIPTVLASEFYVWWRLQQMECYVPANEKKDLFVKPVEYANKLYGDSSSDKDNKSI